MTKFTAKEREAVKWLAKQDYEKWGGNAAMMTGVVPQAIPGSVEIRYNDIIFKMIRRPAPFFLGSST